VATAKSSGTWHALAIWHEAQLDDTRTVSNAPCEGSEALQAITFRAEALEVIEGQELCWEATHDLHNLRIRFAEAAIAPEEEDPELTVSSVSRWHWGMMHDERRNGIYDTAIRKALAKHPQARALDIGSGSGLLAMMLARAGASHVTTVEAVKPISLVAKQIVASNGYGDVITVVNKMSTEMAIGDGEGELPEQCQLCVSEIVDVGLLGEFCLPTMQDACARLLTPGAYVIPRAASVYACIVEVEHRPHALRRPLSAEPSHQGGFDLRLYNTFATETYEQIDINSLRHIRITEPFPVWEFDLCGGQETDRERTQAVDVVEGGVCHAVCFWFSLHLDEELSFSTSPEECTCWNQALFFWPEPALEVQPGMSLHLKLGHDQNRIWFDAPTLGA